MLHVSPEEKHLNGSQLAALDGSLFELELHGRLFFAQEVQASTQYNTPGNFSRVSYLMQLCVR